MLTAVRTAIQKSQDDFYGLIVFKINGKEYATGTVTEAELAARELARECLDQVDTDLILKHGGLPPKARRLVSYIQEGFAIDESEILQSVIEDLDALIEEAVSQQGRAHFLGVFSNRIELSLTQFPSEISRFILRELGLSNAEQVCLYQLG
jgi:hypothetical protein